MQDKKMPLLAHVEELRRRILTALFFIMAFGVAAWIYSDQILDFLTEPIPLLDVPQLKLIFTDVTEAFGAKFMISIIGGIIGAFPILIYQICMFIVPGLLPKERRALFTYLPAMILLFVAGAAFALYPVVPFARAFFVGFGTENLVPMISISSYIDFALMLTLGMGLIFLLPIAVLFVTGIGLVSPKSLSKSRKVVYLVILIAAAAIAPNDGLSMIVISAPVWLLFEISLIIAGARWRKREKLMKDKLYS